MSNQPTGGPAFPVPGFEFLDDRDPTKPERVVNLPAPGMTLRDYFAAKAMQGYLANPWQAQELDATGDSSREQMAVVAEISYVMADALLAERGRSR